MKKILLLILIPFLGFSQNSWINIQLMTDDFPNETSWQLTPPYGSPIIIGQNPAVGINQLYDTTIAVQGQFIASVFDSYGDGLGASQWGGTDGWFLIQNDCQDTIMFVTGDFGVSYIDTLNVAPCAPPAGGCLDSLATNYDSTSAFDDGSCVYPPCSGLDTLWVETYCDITGSKVYFHWANMANPSCRMASYTKSDSPYGLGTNWYPYPGNFSNTGLVFSNQQPNTTYYFLGMLADSSYTDTLVITTGECILGCTDPTALNYNPWANTPDGSCQAPPANCVNGESNIVVTLIPDTYPGETSWDITDTNGTVLATSPLYSIPGVPVITETCVPNGTVINFNLYDGFGDGMCGTCYGGVDGTVLVQTLCGDTILAILPGNADFGMDTSTIYTVQPCIPNSIPGCMDPMYIEYNPQANINDSSCTNLIVLGCTDITSPDYNPSANTMDIIPNCNYTLIITDGAQDGWFGSWIGILQDTTVLGTYTMGPSDGASNSYTINLNSSNPVEILFFTQGNSQTTANQCGFYLIGPEGDTTLSGGTNSWTDPILQFPYRYNATPNCGNYCTPGVLGCMDVTALNYDSSANMPDGNCIVIVLGCTNTLAFNYNSLANVDDGNCVATIIGCMDSTAFNFNPSANTNDALSCIPVILGCMDDTMFNYNAAANTDDGSCIPVIFGCTDLIAFNYNSLANTNNGSCTPVVNGCINPIAFNYNPLANTNDSSCIPYVYGCTDPSMFNYNAIANTDNGTCIPIINGCTDTTMFNYNINANTDNGSCIPYIYGCTDSLAFNFNPLANTDNNGCIPVLLGCTDSLAINYNPLANTNDNSCIAIILGCTDSTAINYNLLANTDDGSCIAIIYGCTDSTMWNYNLLANTNDGSCLPYVYGCTDPTMWNYNILANTDDLSCIPFIYGCTDPTMYNYNPLANTNNNSCVPVINGCTDSLALNFNPLANTDNGSCILPLSGCTDVAAFNYNPLANTSDSTACLYDAGCYGGSGIPYWLNDGCYAWVIDVDDFCCTTDWDISCQSMYDYCQLGWPTSIEDISALGIIVYPNPTKDVITIETRLDIQVELYDIMGKKIISESNIKRLDLSKLPNGLYNMVIFYNDVRFSKKVIKQ